MPHEFNNKIVVTRDELVPRFWSTWEALKKQLSRYREKPYGIKRAQRAGGLGKEILIDFDTLPREIQEELGDPRKLQHVMERFYKTDGEAVRFYAMHKVKGKNLDVYKQEEYIVNASVIRAAIALRAARLEERLRMNWSAPRKGLDQSISDDVNSFNDVLEKKYDEQHTLPTNYRRLKEKIRDFEQNGYETLVDGWLGNRNAAKNTDATKELLERMFARDKVMVKPNPTDVYRRYEGFISGYVEVINPETGEFYDPKNFKKLSQRTVTSFLDTWESKVVTYRIRTGNRQKYMSDFEAFVSLKHPEFAGSIISIDDRQPPFEYAPGKRAWLYLGIDLGSEAYTCWVWGKTKEGMILDFYRAMVRNYAEWGLPLPAELECESSLNSNFKETFLKEGRMFDNVRIEANNARGKRIERYFRSLRYEYEREEDNWIGRPFSLMEANQVRPSAGTMPFEDIIKMSLGKIQEWNNSEHSIHKGKTRWEVFLENQHPSLKPINWVGILPYLGNRTKATCKAGNVKFRNTFYLLGENGEISLGDNLIGLMKQVEGEELDVYWIEGFSGQVLKCIAFCKGRYVCELIRKPLIARATIEQTDEDRANFAIVSHYNNTIRAYATRRKNALEDIVVIDHRKRTLNDKFQIPGVMINTWGNEIKENVEILETREVETELQPCLNENENGIRMSNWI